MGEPQTDLAAGDQRRLHLIAEGQCQRGDVMFSYANGRISQIGLVETAAITASKPLEFG